jgi:hypothetical protein
MQFAYEWQASLARSPGHKHDVDFFFGALRGQSAGQFCTEDSYRARSAFLRSIAVGTVVGALSEEVAEWAALATLPVDPTLAWLRPSPPALGLEPWLSLDSEPDAASHVRDMIRKISEGGVLGACSWVAETRRAFLLDCTVVLWEGPTDGLPSSRSTRDSVDVEAGLITGEGLELGSTCDYSDGFEKESADGYRPLAGVLYPRRYGYTQADVFLRDVFGPIPADRSVPVQAQPQDDRVVFTQSATALGTFGFWDIGWSSSYRRLSKPKLGTYLYLSGRDASRSAFYVWHCRRVARESRYGDDGASDFYGTIPWGLIQPDTTAVADSGAL